MDIDTRWMNRADTPDVLRIMQSCGNTISEKGLNAMMRKSSLLCVVAEVEGRVVGLVMYDVGRVSKIKVIGIFVDQNSRRSGVGRTLVSLLFSKLNKKKNKVETSVSEYNLDAHLFLRSLGFKAVSTSEGDPAEYRFVYRFSESPAVANDSNGDR